MTRVRVQAVVSVANEQEAENFHDIERINARYVRHVTRARAGRRVQQLLHVHILSHAARPTGIDQR